MAVLHFHNLLPVFFKMVFVVELFSSVNLYTTEWLFSFSNLSFIFCMLIDLDIFLLIPSMTIRLLSFF